MNKKKLVAAAAARAGLSKKDTETAVNAMLDVIVDALQQRDRVQLVGFGCFETKLRAARIGRNPNHPDEVFEIPAFVQPCFKPGKMLKDAVQ